MSASTSSFKFNWQEAAVVTDTFKLTLDHLVNGLMVNGLQHDTVYTWRQFLPFRPTWRHPGYAASAVFSDSCLLLVTSQLCSLRFE
jgi:hypothetical protein